MSTIDMNPQDHYNKAQEILNSWEEQAEDYGTFRMVALPEEGMQALRDALDALKVSTHGEGSISENVSIDKARIQRTPNQVITEIWCRDRKLTIYLDKRQNQQGEAHTSVEIYQVEEQSQDIGESKDIVASLLWLAGDYVAPIESEKQ